MKILNYSKDIYISVLNIAGETVQVNPGNTVEVKNYDGVTILDTYSHIFRKVEDEINQDIKRKVSKLEIDLIGRDKKIQELVGHIQSLEKLLLENGVEVTLPVVTEIDGLTLEELQTRYLELTNSKVLPNKYKNNKQRMIDSIKTLEATKTETNETETTPTDQEDTKEGLDEIVK